MTKDLAAELLDLVIDRAKKMRDAGMLEVGLGEGVYVKLAPAELAPDETDVEEDDEDVDVLDDPRTYGRMHGVPGKKRKASR